MSNMENRRTRPLYDTRQKKKKSILGRLMLVLILVLVIAGLTKVVDNALATRKSFMKDVKVCSAAIGSIVAEDSKYYVQISPGADMHANNISLSSDDRWIEVTYSFYTRHKRNDAVGVLMGHYDVFKEKLIGSEMVLERSLWTLDEIYDSLEEAKGKNEYHKYTSLSSIEKKKSFESGNCYFKIRNEDRTFTLKVNKEDYDKYKEKQKIYCQFEKYGDFVKLLSLAEQ
ncbi:MAG TPA: hypothetical protein VIO64_00825 [Pseudobacteroides sp.]|uniref:hypothetical protein n=1 Tax=Pseudobacteroides sp. TaxID=1968840 RepID=UPI002F9354C7